MAFRTPSYSQRSYYRHCHWMTFQTPSYSQRNRYSRNPL
jgi:hypothetical protein